MLVRREKNREIKFIKKDDRSNKKNVVLQDSRMLKECAKCKNERAMQYWEGVHVYTAAPSISNLV